MNVVVVGAKERISEEDKSLVSELIDQIDQRYSACMFISTLTHNGVGKFVKEKCLEKDIKGRFKNQFLDIEIRSYASNLSKVEYGSICLALNATLVELASIVYYFANESRRGTLENLVDRSMAVGIPTKVLLPGEPITLL
jgi:hypothetical protein